MKGDVLEAGSPAALAAQFVPYIARHGVVQAEVIEGVEDAEGFRPWTADEKAAFVDALQANGVEEGE